MKILGKRILVAKEKIDSGGMRLAPETEKDGLSNSGIVKDVGSIGLINHLRGLRKGCKVYFKKHFITNSGKGGEEFVFVNLEDILSIE